VRGLLTATSLPAGLVDRLLEAASPVWLLGESAEGAAAGLALCHPPLVEAEVRAVVAPSSRPRGWSLTIVTHDRPGVLARHAGVVSRHGLAVVQASACSWTTQGLALTRLQVRLDDRVTHGSVDWDALGADLRAPDDHTDPSAVFVPQGPVEVTTSAHGTSRMLVRVRAPDRPGLLWAVAWWLSTEGCNIEALQVGSTRGRADDTFLVRGSVDPGQLTAWLAGRGVAPPAEIAVAARAARVATAALGGLAAGARKAAELAASVTRRPDPP